MAHPILSALWRNKTGPLLVATQVALSLAILANALYIVQVRQAVAARPSGVAHEQQIFGVEVRRMGVGTHQDELALQQRETATLRAVAGVQAAAATNQMPLTRSGNYSGLTTDRKQVVMQANTTNYMVGDSLVQAWELKLVAGRDFLPNEYVEIDMNTSQESPRVAIITRTLARKLFPGVDNVVGKTFYNGNGPTARALQIIGVVERLQTPAAQIDERGEFSTMVPVRLTGMPGNDYTVRAEPGQRDRVMKEVEAALRAASPTPIIVRTKSLDEFRSLRYRADNAMAWMLITVSALLLLITASGIVGMAWSAR